MAHDRKVSPGEVARVGPPRHLSFRNFMPMWANVSGPEWCLALRRRTFSAEDIERNELPAAQLPLVLICINPMREADTTKVKAGHPGNIRES